jgi:hypothetical protein
MFSVKLFILTENYIFSIIVSNLILKNKYKMKKIIFFTSLLLTLALNAAAEQYGILMQISMKNRPDTYTKVNRAPRRITLDVVYDSDTHCIIVIGSDSLDAEVFLYNESGEIEDYSSSLNSNLQVSTQGYHKIQIEGDDWSAEGSVNI